MARRSNADPPRPERVAAFGLGLSAESRAAAYLIAKGYWIVARRFRTPFGEVDIVARRRGVLIFVEVKARSTLDAAAEALLVRQQRRIADAAARSMRQRRRCRCASSAGSPTRRRSGFRSIRMTSGATSASTPCWSRRERFHAISRLLLKPTSLRRRESAG
jgi:putative endonuclease